jgi:apolipoprotein D and lipocalin family protein
MKSFVVASLQLILLGSAFGSGKTMEVVVELDLKRYMGLWYEIARYPNVFQKSCAGEVTAQYTLRADGNVTVLNSCTEKNGERKRAEGVARKQKEAGPNSKLEVRFAPSFLSFLPFVWGDYWVIDLAEDYSYAVVGHPGRKYLWVLSRTPTLDEDTYEGIVARIAEQGYDVSRLEKTRQKP